MKFKTTGVIISVLILALLLYFGDPYKIYKELINVNLGYLLLALFVGTLSPLLRVLRWKYLLPSSMKIKIIELGAVQYLGMVISGFTPGRVGEPLKALILKGITGTRVSKSLKSVVWERILDLIVILLFSIGFFLFYLTSKNYLTQNIQYIFLAIIILIVMAVIVVNNQKAGMFLLDISRKIPKINKMITREFIKSFYQSTIRKRTILFSFLLTVIIWFFDGLVFYFVFKGLGIQKPLLVFVFLVSLSVIIGLVSFLPGGLGTTEGSFAFILIGLGITKSSAVSGVFLGRLLTFWYGTLLGYLSFLYLSNKIDFKKIKLFRKS